MYYVPMVSKALDILELIQGENQPLSIESIYRRTKYSKTTIYRIARTLVQRGYLAQQDGLYRPLSRPRKMRFGFAAQSSDMPFSQAVADSLATAAAASGVELVALDNRYDAETAVQNAKKFVSER